MIAGIGMIQRILKRAASCTKVNVGFDTKNQSDDSRMNTVLKSLIALVIIFFVSIPFAVIAQSSPENVTGRITGKSKGGSWHFEMRDNLSANERQHYAVMKQQLLHIFSVITKVPVLDPPKGFDIDPSLAAYCDLDPVFSSRNGAGNEKDPIQGVISMMSFNYYVDQNSHKIRKGEESHGGLDLHVNDVSDVLPDEFKNLCSDACTPLFFFLPDITIKDPGKIVIGDQVIILKEKDRPVFTPLTQKGIMQFMIRKMQHDLSGLKDDVQENKDNLTGYLKMAKQYQDPKTEALYRENIVAAENKVDSTSRMILNYRNSFAKMTSLELQAPVYVVRDFNDPDFDYYKLSTSSAKGAKELYTFNPNYYNPTLPRSAIQLLVVGYHASNFCPPFMKDRLRDWFQQINYNGLAEAIAK